MATTTSPYTIRRAFHTACRTVSTCDGVLNQSRQFVPVDLSTGTRYTKENTNKTTSWYTFEIADRSNGSLRLRLPQPSSLLKLARKGLRVVQALAYTLQEQRQSTLTPLKMILLHNPAVPSLFSDKKKKPLNMQSPPIEWHRRAKREREHNKTQDLQT